MNSQDFADWRRHPVTQIVHEIIRDRIEEGKEELALSAGTDPILDSRKVGKLMALQDFLDIDLEDAK